MFRSAAAAGVVYLMVAGGCTAPPFIPQDQIIGELSRAVLQPEVTCEDLQLAFGLEDYTIPETPADAGLAFEEHWLATETREYLRTWYMPADLDRGLVVLSTGNAGPMNCYLYAASLLVENGWTVVLYEYQGFGYSTGEPSLATMAPNLEMVAEWAIEKTGHPNATLYGMSLGSVPSIAVAALRPDIVNGIVLDSPVAFATLIQRFGFLLGGEADRIVADLGTDLNTDETIKRVRQPAIFLLNERDTVTPADTVEGLFDSAAGPKELVRFPNLFHAFAQFYRTDLYVNRIENFLATIWPQRAVTPTATSSMIVEREAEPASK